MLWPEIMDCIHETIIIWPTGGCGTTARDGQQRDAKREKTREGDVLGQEKIST